MTKFRWVLALAIVGFLYWPTLAVAADDDGDGIEDALDNCPNIANPGQEDYDLDGIGDVCSPEWSARVIIRNNDNFLDAPRTSVPFYAGPIHATLLPPFTDGKVLMVGGSSDVFEPMSSSEISMSSWWVGTLDTVEFGEPIPPQVFIPNEIPSLLPYEFSQTVIGDTTWDDTLYCGGHTLTPDGALVVAGGHRNAFSPGSLTQFGSPNAMIFKNNTWTRLDAQMTGIGTRGLPNRWYPAVTWLSSGQILVTSGHDQVGFPNTSVELLRSDSFDPTDQASFSWTEISKHIPLTGPEPGETYSPSEIFNHDYTHVFEQPNGDVLMFGKFGVPVFMTVTEPAVWTVMSGNPRPGDPAVDFPNAGASSTLMPIRVANGEWGYSNGSVFMAGGEHETAFQHRVDLYDPIIDQWHPTQSMGVRRHHPTTVLLPNGKVLIVAGHDEGGNLESNKVHYLDPANGMQLTKGRTRESLGSQRGYHNISILLPDGSVLVGGGRSHGPGSFPLEKATIRYFYPSYMYHPRPEIVVDPIDRLSNGESYPLMACYDEPMQFDWTGDGLSEVVLMSYGSMTHSFNMNQRNVQLFSLCVQGDCDQLSSGRAFAKNVQPPTLLPPGFYLMFMLDKNRIPSVARNVKMFETCAERDAAIALNPNLP